MLWPSWRELFDVKLNFPQFFYEIDMRARVKESNKVRFCRYMLLYICMYVSNNRVSNSVRKKKGMKNSHVTPKATDHRSINTLPNEKLFIVSSSSFIFPPSNKFAYNRPWEQYRSRTERRRAMRDLKKLIVHCHCTSSRIFLSLPPLDRSIAVCLIDKKQTFECEFFSHCSFTSDYYFVLHVHCRECTVCFLCSTGKRHRAMRFKGEQLEDDDDEWTQFLIIFSFLLLLLLLLTFKLLFIDWIYLFFQNE